MIDKLLSPANWIALAVVAALQTAALATMVYGRVTLLSDGREIVARVIPVDPRDLFRGDYVILGYAFGRSEVAVPEGTVAGDTVYATLRETAPEEWEVVSIAPTRTAPADPAQVVLKGTVAYVTSGGGGGGAPPRAQITYGIESYFVPEGSGRTLEAQVRDKKISAVLAVGARGDVAIKALVVDGQRLVEEPWL